MHERVNAAVKQELQKPGELLGYRAMQVKIRQVHKTVSLRCYVRYRPKRSGKSGTMS